MDKLLDNIEIQLNMLCACQMSHFNHQAFRKKKKHHKVCLKSLFFKVHILLSFSELYFQVITAFQNVELSADSRKEMDEWICALKSVSSRTSSVSLLVTQYFCSK